MDRAGIREVAKAAGVSISTVSRAFTRPELVSERTRRKVLETADKLDFNISRSATSLKSGQSYRVAMLMNEEITSWFNTEVFAGIESVSIMPGMTYRCSSMSTPPKIARNSSRICPSAATWTPYS